jgi:hypothetical protein
MRNIVGLVTSLYIVPEIIEHTSMSLFVVALGLQALHDAVCILFFALYIHSFRNIVYLHLLNCLHGVIMMLFCYYKRCILTLLYNHNYVTGIDMCMHYISLCGSKPIIF